MATALIILAAGQGTRMNSDLPKVLHPIGGAPMLGHAMQAGATLEPDQVIVVAGHGAEAVRAAALEFEESAEIVIQSEQLGTAHAVAQAAPCLAGYEGDALVLYGDTPFIQPDTLERMQAARGAHDIVVLGFEAADPGRYGRLVVQSNDLLRIVEFKDATAAERAVTLCNSGVVLAPAALLFDLIAEVGNANAAGEYYGVTLVAPDTVQFAYDTWLGRDSLVEPYVVFGAGVTVETGAHIRAFSHLEGCHVARGAVVGPYARLRPGTELAEHARIGNFVEVKNALIGEGAKVNHLSYIGDARVGDESNIGAGTITCNYDGVSKHETVIGARVFVGSNTMLVAPVTLGDGAMTGSGSVITRDVAPDALSIARAPQVDMPGRARKLFDLLKARAGKRDKGAM